MFYQILLSTQENSFYFFSTLIINNSASKLCAKVWDDKHNKSNNSIMYKKKILLASPECLSQINYTVCQTYKWYYLKEKVYSSNLIFGCSLHKIYIRKYKLNYVWTVLLLTAYSDIYQSVGKYMYVAVFSAFLKKIWQKKIFWIKY